MYFLSLPSPLVSPITAHRIRCCPRRRSMRMVPLCAVKEVFMPALSSTMTEGKIVSWLKSEGEKVAKGEPIVVVESDKADMDVESFNDGILGKIVVEEGGVAGVGAPIAYLADSEADVAEAQNKGDGAASNGTAAPVSQAKPETVRSHEICPSLHLDLFGRRLKRINPRLSPWQYQRVRYPSLWFLLHQLLCRFLDLMAASLRRLMRRNLLRN